MKLMYLGGLMIGFGIGWGFCTVLYPGFDLLFRYHIDENLAGPVRNAVAAIIFLAGTLIGGYIVIRAQWHKANPGQLSEHFV